MDRQSKTAVKVYSKYGVTFFYLYVLKIFIKNYFSNKKEIKYGWHFNFSNGLAPKNLQVRSIDTEFENISNANFKKSEIKEDVYPLS